MELEQQVVSLDLARKLKELGIEQTSVFYWKEYQNIWSISLSEKPWAKYNDRWCSAFLVSELGELLPFNYSSIRSDSRPNEWQAVGESHTVVKVNSYSETEADCRAKILIYLIENGIVKP